MINGEKTEADKAKIEIRISVRQLVEFLLRAGDINLPGFVDMEPMLEGSRIHRKLQKEAGPGYKAEVRLSYRREYDKFVLVIDGIADGIFISDDIATIDEIKTVSTPLEDISEDYSPLHWAQAQVYAYMHAQGVETKPVEGKIAEGSDPAAKIVKGLDPLIKIRIRLTYYNVDTKNVKYIIRELSFQELEEYFEGLLSQYRVWAELQAEHITERNRSTRELAFPFREYRKGQRNLAAAVYKTIRDKNRLYAQAPTGTGKTMSTLFPAVKALAEGHGEKIFYLTAKAVTREVPEKALALMQSNGLTIKSITITSRERICRCENKGCSPDNCAYAKGHYDRVNNALLDILSNETLITRDILEAYSEKHTVCPFEYSLDISLWSDAIICDYNYVFDPRAYLRRYFEFGGDYILLIDEGHNLVERARDMYSAVISKRAFMELKNEIKSVSPRGHKLFNKINKYFVALRKQLAEAENNSDESATSTGTVGVAAADKGEVAAVIGLPKELLELVEEFLEEWKEFTGRNRYNIASEAMLQLFFDCLTLVTVGRLFDEHYVAYAETVDRDLRIKLFCVDPSALLRNACAKCRAAVFFSATLLPLEFFKTMLGGEPEDKCVRLPSPFPRENLCLMASDNISTRYRDRNDTSLMVARYIKEATGTRTGNFIVFFPSFEYLRKVYHIYRETWPGDRTIVQESYMKDEDREAYLSNFTENPQETLVAFAVMGGIFSEGIDLTGDRLSGAVVIGVGIPQISFERQLISNFFKEQRDSGYEYAYMYPGMNRVLQAAGRIIRTETDRGFILLLDERFLQWRYQELFPPEWEGFERISSPVRVRKLLEDFWNGEGRRENEPS